MAELRATYKGSLRGTLRDGPGTFVFENPYFSYEGEYKEGLRHGHGTLLFGRGGADGTLTGEWQRGELVGTVERRWSDGRAYVGPMAAGMMHGEGVLAAGETEYRGSFVSNCKHGHGKEVLTTEHGVVEFEGEWAGGKRHGRGVERRGNRTVEGEWVHGSQHGDAVISDTLELEEGSVLCRMSYRGEAEAGVPHGDGSISLSPLGGGDEDRGGEEAAGTMETGKDEGARESQAEGPVAEAPAGEAASGAGESPGRGVVAYSGLFERGRPVRWPSMLVASLASDWKQQLPEATGEEEAGGSGGGKKGKQADKGGKKKGKQAPSPATGTEEGDAAGGGVLAKGTPCGGGWQRRGDSPAAAEGEEGEDATASATTAENDDDGDAVPGMAEWGHNEAIAAALVEARQEELRLAALQASADDRWATSHEPLFHVHAGQALPALLLHALCSPAGPGEAVAAAEAVAADRRAEADRLIAEEDEATAGKKKKAGKKKGGELPTVSVASVISPETHCLPWEELASTTSGITLEAALVPRTGGDRAETSALGSGSERGTVRVPVEGGVARLQGLAVPADAPHGDYTLLVRDVSVTPFGRANAAHVRVRVHPAPATEAEASEE